jgi:hypothetical protein
MGPYTGGWLLEGPVAARLGATVGGGMVQYDDGVVSVDGARKRTDPSPMER